MEARIKRTVVWLAILAMTALGVKACAGSTTTVEPTAVAVVIPTTTLEPQLPTTVPPTDTPAPPIETPAARAATATEEPASPTLAPPEDTPTPEPEATATPEEEPVAESSDNCIGCHQVEESHGDGNEYAHRYDGGNMPTGTDCTRTSSAAQMACLSTACTRTRLFLTADDVLPEELDANQGAVMIAGQRQLCPSFVLRRF